MATTTAPRRILIVDDEQSICDVLTIALKKDGYQVSAETNPRKALELFQRERFDLVLQDLKMPEMDGIDLLREIKRLREDSIVVVMTAYSTWERAVEAMRLGAFHYIKKPFDNNTDIRAAVSRALRVKELGAQLTRSFDEAMQQMGILMGDSAAIREVRELVRRVAPTDSTVLIQGASGTGKELVARALHYGSPRAGKPFVAVNCGAIPEQLLESEVFGHVRGAFTGATADKVGLLETAGGGTFFLDEISEMPWALQVKFLRAIEEREFKPVGSSQTRTADVRFITATNRDLSAETKAARFRPDLYYRLNVISIIIPPLKDRRGDIPILAGYFLRKFSQEMGKPVRQFTAAAREALERHDWPGNVRELENAIQRAVALCDGEHIDAGDLNLEVSRLEPIRVEATSHLPEEGLDLDRTLAEIEVGYLKEALRRTGGNYTNAAQILRMSLRSLRYKLQKYGLDKDSY
ncbi:MAG: sigma-54-dependent Fis family transcriptional regulator [Planctomycetes bacterium]|nr:sigma-54-dependent Fis family transcriptional regulator [Planctomycetota bacterium]